MATSLVTVKEVGRDGIAIGQPNNFTLGSDGTLYGKKSSLVRWSVSSVPKTI